MSSVRILLVFALALFIKFPFANIYNSTESCGQKVPGKKALAELGQYPWNGFLVKKPVDFHIKVFCNGAIITQRHLFVTKSCIDYHPSDPNSQDAVYLIEMILILVIQLYKRQNAIKIYPQQYNAHIGMILV
ncbi:unnamed protein product [Lepeophtheirus salmonis]|uniref:(salmon louse) hypothetical protein n=1 Tax=Lepeophtheirus salmonis TaxID=72036 RepID=A0A7R8HDL2_LEPSM|nr:unnamed protein product [Lepeophtheirus salmonis]CAF3037031.1 unnamed protein product [Lepeophtheirus salmonis]